MKNFSNKDKLKKQSLKDSSEEENNSKSSTVITNFFDKSSNQLF